MQPHRRRAAPAGKEGFTFSSNSAPLVLFWGVGALGWDAHSDGIGWEGGLLNASPGAVIDGMLCEMNMPWWDAPPPQYLTQFYPPPSFNLLCSTPPTPDASTSDSICLHD